MGILFFILVFVATVWVDAYTDARLILAGKAVNHLRGALIRLVPLTAATLLVTTHWFYMGLWLTMAGAFYWLIFDIVLNRMRGLPWHYQGIASDKEEDAFSDNLIDDFPVLIRLLVKIATILLSILAWHQREEIWNLLLRLSEFIQTIF